MPVIAEFKVISFDQFSDQPKGSGDPSFTLADPFDKTQMLTVVISDDDSNIDGDALVEEEADDLGQTADIYDANGTLLYDDIPIYVEWRANYTNDADPSDTLEMWRFELDRDYLPPGDNVRMFAVDSIPEPGASYSTTNKDMDPLDVDASDMDAVVCYTSGTLIDCENGAVEIEQIAVGDMVITHENGPRPVRWTGERTIGLAELNENPKLRPVKILAGALGPGLPRQDLSVSRQHRMLVSSKIALRMFGARNVLVSAIRLTDLPGVFVDTECESVTYHHILFDRHEIIFAQGTPSESLFTGPEALKTIPEAARKEIFEIFPELENAAGDQEPAFLVPQGRRQRQLIHRLAKNQRPALEAFDAGA